MKVVGIIAEYNPFHNGHLYHLNESKKKAGADAVIVAMSGNFTQRGEPALLDKWERAKVAVCCGADLVLEIPFVYACNNAEFFAKGGIELLSGLGCVDVLSFGSESGDLQLLRKVANVISAETFEFKECLKEELQTGIAYPKARALAVRRTAGEESAAILSEPNNILAAEYLKQLFLLNSKMQPITVARKGAGYHTTELSGVFSSATSIRNEISAGTDWAEIKLALPEESLTVLKEMNYDVHKILNNYYTMLLSRILTAGEDELEAILTAGEGLGNKMKKAIRQSENISDLILAVKSKRYTQTRVQRLLVHTLLHLTKDSFDQMIGHPAAYARVLAFNASGSTLLRNIKKSKEGIAVITNVNKQSPDTEVARKLLKYDLLASDIYNALLGRSIYDYSDYVRRPYQKFAENT